MGDVAQLDRSSPAVEETLGLLRPGSGSSPSLDSGYIDLLGDRDPIGNSFAQRTMQSRGVVRIYERLWRPAVTRVFFGVRGPRIARERAMALGMLGVAPGDRVLDVGCGPGNYTRHLAAAVGGDLVIGLDPSRPMLASAARRTVGMNVAYVRGDGSELPFEDASFDAVSCFGTLHLIEDPMKALDEMIRVLAPGGRLGLLATCATAGRRRTRRQAPKGIRVFGRDELTDALAARGLVDVQQRVIGRGQFVAARRPEA